MTYGECMCEGCLAAIKEERRREERAAGAKLRKRLLGAGILTLDDIGKENANAWAMTTLFQVVNSHYDGMRPTVFASQYSIPQLQNRMSRACERETAEAICSRIEELSDVVSLSNIDRRRTR